MAHSRLNTTPQSEFSEEALACHAINLLSYFGSQRLQKLKSHFKSFSFARNTHAEKLAQLGFIPEAEIKAWQDMQTHTDHSLASTLQTHGIKIIIQEDALYPQALLRLPDPPQILYYRGDLSALTCPGLAIVGTRHASAYGYQALRTLMPEYGCTIISGLAFGIDSASHRHALEYNLPTVAVLASGCDTLSITPKSHYSLAEKILQSGGLILSEYPPDTPAYPSQFIQRNRIIAGLSKVVLIIEAPITSGALHTARASLENGITTLVVPGSIHEPTVLGSHRLIQEGALLAAQPSDVLLALGYSPKKKKAARLSEKRAAHLTETQRSLYNVIRTRSVSFEEIKKTLNYDTSTLMVDVSMLELQQLIVRNISGLYEIK